MSTDGSFMLPSGRTLAFERFGRRGGTPLFYFHGYPGSRRDYRFVDPDGGLAEREGFDVVAVSRPGYDGSTADPQRTLASWSDDVAAAAATLGWRRFSVVGYSGGGPYALACASLLPEAVTAAACIAAVGPPGTPDQGRSLGLVYTTLGEPARSALMNTMSLLSSLNMPAWWPGVTEDRLALAAVRIILPRTDAHYLGDPRRAAGLLDTWRAAFADGPGGGIRDAELYAESWPFELAALRVPVSVWHGSGDVNVLPTAAEHLASAIPNATLHLLPELGHLSVLTRYSDVLRDLHRLASRGP